MIPAPRWNLVSVSKEKEKSRLHAYMSSRRKSVWHRFATRSTVTHGRRRVFSYVNALETPEKKIGGRDRKQDIYINVVIPRIVSQMGQHTFSALPETWVISLVSCSFALLRLIQPFSRNDSTVFGQVKKQNNPLKPLQVFQSPGLFSLSTPGVRAIK
ncbi:hypothetical protein BDV59DRAFT_188685 [Aspergillus ambiguus]|uniref:uncharacterized protein n=1 Tax=Aspergillus ambiguus TaxID=176160 RepID=UPI003CCDEB9A